MKLVPDRKKFMEVIGNSENVNEDIEKFCSSFSPVLKEIHKFLVRFHCSYDNKNCTFYMHLIQNS